MRMKLKQHQMETLGLGNFRDAVKLPEGGDLDEWMAVHCVDFYNQISMLFATITEFCTPETCPKMTAGPGYLYLWAENGERAREVSAPVYVSLLMDWIERQIDDESVFPSMPDQPFPRGFHNVVKTIMKRLFRVYAHCYYHHRQTFTDLDEMVHLNTSFKHFIFFVLEFELIPIAQLKPLQPIIDQILAEAQ